TGRQYHLFEYSGAADAERVVVVMGSGGETVEETVRALHARGERVGVLKVCLYRPSAADGLIAALPATVTSIAVLDRTKEPGSDGTVGANKNSIKIIGEGTHLFTQGYFVYDSKKSGSVTVSHLRFGPQPIHAPYLIGEADFIACHQFGFLERFAVLDSARLGATFLLNSPFGPESVWDHLPRQVQQAICENQLRF